MQSEAISGRGDPAGTRIVPAVLSGGAGTRLWPVSRSLLPKQLQPLVGPESLLAETLVRVSDPRLFAPPLIVCNEEHRFLVAETLRRSGRDGGRMVLEPVGRNTAPAACVAALLAGADEPEALVLLLPSDHHVTDPAALAAALERAVPAARAGRLVTFGVPPLRPETGFGYIQRGAALPGLSGCHAVARFIEKPERARAEALLAAGDTLWNSGLYLFRADRLLAELERLAPEILVACRAAVAGAAPDLDFLRLEAAAFASAPSISLDYAIAEKTDAAAVVPAEMGWSDVGSWHGLWSILPRDAEGNATRGDVLAVDCRDSYLRSDRGLLAALGVEDLIVVVTDDAVLVCPRARAAEVGTLTATLKDRSRAEALHHTLVHRPWGSYQSVDAGPGFQVKRLVIKPGASISLQRHRQRAEHWVVVRGEAEVTRDDAVFRLAVNESTYIPLGAVHRLHNPGPEPLEIVEVQTGAYFGEDDIERLDDAYGRVVAE